jgi:DNA primase
MEGCPAPVKKEDMTSNKEHWIDFDDIKARLSMEEVLQHYGITELKKGRNCLYGCCPIHKGDNKTAFNVSLNNNLWHCFTHCGGGSVIDFIMKMENVGVYEAGLIAEKMLSSTKRKKRIAPKIKPTGKAERVRVNPPLDFELTLDPKHPYLKKRGLKLETIKHFGIGYCNMGLLKGMIAIPIHNEKGELIAYAGRRTDEQEPKYKLPLGFNKSQVVYNLHQAKDYPELILVEGFFDVFKLHQNGYPNVVALMGSTISNKQAKLLIKTRKKTTVMLDGDEAGKKGTKEVAEKLKGKLPLKVIKLAKNIQPESLGKSQLMKCL